MNTFERTVPRASRTRVHPLLVCVTLGAMACGELTELEAERPSIAVAESRCGTVELVGLRRADRLVAASDGRLGLAGTRVDLDREEAGRAFELDPRSGAARVFDDPHPRTLATWIDGVLYTDERSALVPADPRADAAPRFPLPEGLRTDRIGRAADVWIDGDRALLATRPNDAVRPEAVVQIADDGRSVALEAHFGVLGARLGDDWIDAAPSIRSFVPGPDGRVYAVGRARAAAVEHAALPASDRPRDYIGFVSVARGARPSADGEAFEAVEHSVSTWRQPDFWPLRVMLDHRGRPTVLYIVGHDGKRIAAGRPYIARLSPEGALIDPEPLPLPHLGSQPAEHGGVQAALPLEDGGWLVGGSACLPGRSLCKGFVSRLDRKLAVQWTGFVVREAASAVVDLQRIDGRIYALGVSSPYCCEYDSYENGAWLVEFEADGACPDTPSFGAHGRWLR